MTATLIAVDFKARKKLYTEQLAGPDKTVPGVNVAQNKRLINDMSQMLNDNIEHLDLYPAILLIPHPERDIYVKINGTDIEEADIKAIGAIHRKMRQRHVQP